MTPNEPTHPESNRYSRRHVLAASTAAAAAVAGCLGDGDGDGDEPDGAEDGAEQPDPGVTTVENPPSRVYKPTHRESMVMDPMIHADGGDYTLLPHFTYEHTFWLMRGGSDEPVREDPEEPGIHLMVAVLDSVTGEQIPLDIVSEMTIRQDGELVDRRDPWPMIAQSMGFHFGDNIPLEYGTYEVELRLDPIDARKTGAFEGRFEHAQTATYTLEYDEEARIGTIEGIEWLPEDEWGQPGALDLMDHDGHGHDDHGGHDDHSHDDHGGHDDHSHDDHGGHDGHEHGDHGHPEMDLPPAAEYPGTDLGVHSSGDADFVVRQLEDSRLAENDEDYLLVSPRTPYNRIPLPDMSLSVEGDIGGELVQTLDDELGHHYGLTVDFDDVEQFEIVVETPPQVSRHAGYETAFIDMPPMTVTVDVGDGADATSPY